MVKELRDMDAIVARIELIRKSVENDYTSSIILVERGYEHRFVGKVPGTNAEMYDLFQVGGKNPVKYEDAQNQLKQLDALWLIDMLEIVLEQEPYSRMFPYTIIEHPVDSPRIP